MRRLSVGSVPRTYDAGAMTRLFNRVEDAVNRIEGSVGQLARDIGRTPVDRQSVGGVARLQTPMAVYEWTEYDDGGGNIYVEGVIYFTQGWARITNVQYRAASTTTGGNIDSTTSWINWNDGGSDMSFVTDDSYDAGGYYRLRLAMPIIKQGDKKTVFTVDIRALDANDAVWVRSSHSFDPDKDPDIYNLSLITGNWDEAAGTWELFATGNADNDTQSVAFAVQSGSDLGADSSLIDADFSTGTTNLVTSDKRFNVSLGTFSPSTESADVDVYVVAKAWTGATKSGDGQRPPYKRQRITMPMDPFDSTLIDDGEITANLLEDSAHRASIRINGRHKTGFEDSTIQYNGYIVFNDGTTYSMAGDGTTYQDLAPGSSSLYYIYFDPGTSATTLQITTSESTAKALSGHKILVGLVQTATSPERAFYVFTGDQPVITAPFVYTAKLSALSADMGTLTAGEVTITNGLNTLWLNPSGSLGILALGPTASGYAAAPFRVTAAGILTATGADISGTVNITSTSTQTADLNLSNPGKLTVGTMQFGYATTGGSDGLYITADNYWYTTGLMKVGGPSQYMSWNGSALSLVGSVTMSAASGLSADLTISGSGKITIGSMAYGYNVSGANDGLFIDASNYWYDSGAFRMGGANGITYAGAGNVTVGTGVDVEGDLTGGSMTLSGSLSVTGSISISSGTLSVASRIYIDPNAFGVNREGIYLWDGTRNRVEIGEVTAGVYGFRTYDSSGNLVLDTTSTGSLENASIQNLTIAGVLQTSGYGAGIGVYISTSRVEVAASATTKIYMDAGLLTATSASGTTSISSTSVSSTALFATSYAQVPYLQYTGISAPGGLAGTARLFANTSNVLYTYEGASGPYLIYHSGNLPASGGTVTSVATGAGLTGGPITTTGTISPDFNGLANSGTLVGTDYLVSVDGTLSRKSQISAIPLSIFSNDAGFISSIEFTSLSTGTASELLTDGADIVFLTAGGNSRQIEFYDAPLRKTLFVQHDAWGATASTTESTLISSTAGDYKGSDTLKASWFEQGKHLHITASGYYIGNGSNTHYLRFRIGGLAGTLVASKTLVMPNTSSAALNWMLNIQVACESTSGTTAYIYVVGDFQVEQTDGTYISYRVGDDAVYTITSITSTKQLVLSTDWASTSASQELYLTQATFEEVY